MNPKRILFGALAALAAGTTLAPLPASACSRQARRSTRVYRRVSTNSYQTTRRVYYRPTYERYRSVYYTERPDYDYRPVYRYRTAYDDDYGYGGRSCERRRTVSRYSCDDCGERFASSYWLAYHHRHSDCD